MPDEDRKRREPHNEQSEVRADDPREDGQGDHPHKKGEMVSGHEANPYDQLPSKPLDSSGEVF